MKKISSIFIGLILIMSLVGCSGQGEQANDTTDAQAPEVKRKIEIYGKVAVGEKEQINFSQGIKIKEVFVKSGQIVAKGDKLFSVDLDDLKAQASILKLQIASAEKQLALGNPAYGKAGLAIRQLKDKLAIAQKVYQDNKVLYNANAISKKVLDESKNSIDELVNSIKQAEYDMSSAANTDSQADTTKQVDLAQSKNKLEGIEKVLKSPMLKDDAIISAMDKALVVEINAQNGSFLTAYSPVLVLSNASKVIIKANLAEEQLKEIALGKKVEVKPVFDKDLKITGEISFISSQAIFANNETVIPLEITCQETEKLLPNLNVDVVIPLEE